MELSKDRERFLIALDEEIKMANAELLDKMAEAIVSALRESEEQGDLLELVDRMLTLDESIVSKLEFIISTSFIERNLHKIEGGRYAN